MPFSHRGSSRRAFLQKAVAAAATVSGYPALGVGREITSQPSAAPQVRPFELDEITIRELQDGMKSSRFTARLLVEKYSERIDEIDKAGACRLQSSEGFIRGTEIARGRRRDSGQDEPERVGEHSLQSFGQRMEWPRRTDSQSICTGPESLRIEFWNRCRNFRESRRSRNWNGDRWVDRLPFFLQRAGRY